MPRLAPVRRHVHPDDATPTSAVGVPLQRDIAGAEGDRGPIQGAANGRLDGGLLDSRRLGEVDVVPIHRGREGLVILLLPKSAILLLPGPHPGQPLHISGPRDPGDHRPQGVAVVPREVLAVHGVGQEAVPVRVQGLAGRNGGSVALARDRVTVQALEVDVAPVLGVLQARVEQDVPQPHPLPLGGPDGPHGPR